MNFELANKVEIVNPYANIDAMYGPYSNLSEALSAIPIELRIIGRTVGIITDTHIDEYWWKNGVKDSDLVLKATKISNTSELINDGEDGIHPFITTEDIPEVDISTKAETDASNIDDNLHIWRQKIDANYVHDQAIPESIWTINHPLNKKVSVTVTDTAGTVIEGEVIIDNGSQIMITFNAPFSGIAVLN